LEKEIKVAKLGTPEKIYFFNEVVFLLLIKYVRKKKKIFFRNPLLFDGKDGFCLHLLFQEK
jgi:hypothetical protein